MNNEPQQDWSLKMAAPLEPGIVCVDMDRMLNFYLKVLRFEFVSDAQASAEMSAKFGTGPDGFRIIRLQTSYGERIKLVQPKRMSLMQNPIPDWVFARQGIAYLTFIVASVQEVLDHLKGFDIKRMSADPVHIRAGITAIFVCDPEGNFLEFVQYADLNAYRPDLLAGPTSSQGSRNV